MQSGGPAGSSDAGDDPPTRDGFRDALAEISGRMERIMDEKLERMVDALPRVVPEAPPAGGMSAAGGGGESRGGRHAPPGAGLPTDQAPNAERGLEGGRGLLGLAPRESTPSVGDVLRENAHHEPASMARAGTDVCALDWRRVEFSHQNMCITRQEKGHRRQGDGRREDGRRIKPGGTKRHTRQVMGLLSDVT